MRFIRILCVFLSSFLWEVYGGDNPSFLVPFPNIAKQRVWAQGHYLPVISSIMVAPEADVPPTPTSFPRTFVLRDGKIRHPILNNAYVLTQLPADICSEIHTNLMKGEADVLADGEYIYAISEELDMRIFPSGRYLFLRGRTSGDRTLFELQRKIQLQWASQGKTHDYLFGSQNVLVAGELSIRNGKIAIISNESGHFRPHAWNLFHGVEAYKRKYPEIFTPDLMTFFYTRTGTFTPFLKMSWADFLIQKPWVQEIQYASCCVIRFIRGDLSIDPWNVRQNMFADTELRSPTFERHAEFDDEQEKRELCKGIMRDPMRERYKARYLSIFDLEGGILDHMNRLRELIDSKIPSYVHRKRRLIKALGAYIRISRFPT